MKSLGQSTILLGLVAVTILVSVVLMAFNIYKTANPAQDAKVEEHWKNNKLLLITPTVTNVLAMVLLAVMYVV